VISGALRGTAFANNPGDKEETMRIRSLAPLGLTLAFGLAGCGGRSVADGEDAAGVVDAVVSPDLAVPRVDGGPLPDQAAIADAAPVGACVIAARFQGCCVEAVAAGELQIEADPCLEPWDKRYQRPAGCPLPEQCHLAGVCREPVPLTRVVGPGPDGSCAFLDECTTAGDCVLAVDARICCDCPAAYPRVEVFNDLCLLRWGEGEDDCVDKCAADVMCEQCPPLPESITCVGAGPQLEAGLKGCWAGIPPP
jgi:hypothetical protein